MPEHSQPDFIELPLVSQSFVLLHIKYSRSDLPEGFRPRGLNTLTFVNYFRSAALILLTGNEISFISSSKSPYLLPRRCSKTLIFQLAIPLRPSVTLINSRFRPNLCTRVGALIRRCNFASVLMSKRNNPSFSRCRAALQNIFVQSANFNTWFIESNTQMMTSNFFPRSKLTMSF